MRTLIRVCVAIALCISCGSGSTGGGSGGPGSTAFTLKVTTAGNGVVRGAGPDCRGSCSAQLAAGSQVHLVAVPDSGSSFSGWAGACSGTGGCDLTLDADREVVASFAAVAPPSGKQRLVVVVQGKGRVTSSPAGIDCDSASCNAAFDSGTAVTLSAAPAAGFTFSGWGNDCSGAGACTVTLSRQATVFANFVAQPPSQVHLVASVKGPGTITGGGLNCGESTFTCDVVVASGTAVTLTATAAGATRFSGWGGACSGTSGTCQLTVQGDTNVSAEFQSEVLVLAPNDGTNFFNLALNSTHLFWMRFVSGASGIWAVPKNGGVAVKVVSGQATAIVADDGFLYWTDSSNLYSTPVGGGGEVALLATGSGIGRLALDENGALYWVDGQFSGNGSVHRMQSRADTVLARGQNTTGPVAVDATHVYYGIDGAIRRVARGGANLAVENVFVCSVRCSPIALRADPRFLYFRISFFSGPVAGTHVMAFRKADGDLRFIDRGNPPGFGSELDANGGVVYWENSGGNLPLGIYRVNSDGSGSAPVDTSDDPQWRGVRVDDVAVYYWHAGAIIRRLK